MSTQAAAPPQQPPTRTAVGAAAPDPGRPWRCGYGSCTTMLGELRARSVLIVVRAGHRRRTITASYPVTQTCPTCGQERTRTGP